MTGLIQVEAASVPSQIGPGRNWARLLGIALLALASAVYAGFRLFTGFSFYDDEGSLVLMSRWMTEGHPVYRDFHSIYGPFYYLYKLVAHTVTGGVVSHATSRLIAMAPWVLTNLLIFAYTLRVTRSRVAALAVWLVTLRALAFIAAEPGHPQEICVLLTIGLLAVTATRGRPVHLAIAGALVAALTLTKINLGVYAGAGVLLVALAATRAASRSRRVRGVLFAAMASICVAAPFCLMAPLIGESWVRACCALITASMIPIVAILILHPPDRVLGARHWMALAAGFAGCAVLALAWGVGQGASLASIARSAVLANLRESYTWEVPLTAVVPGVLAAVAGLATAGLCLFGKRQAWVDWLKLATGLATLGLAMLNRNDLAFAIALPFVWLVMLPAGSSVFPPLQRALLAAVTVLDGLNVYPVAASQVRFTIVLLAIVATVYVHDAIVALTAGWTWDAQRRKRAQLALAALPIAAYLVSVSNAVRVYVQLAPLDFPGTSGIHVDPDNRATYQWTVQKINQSCDSFVSFPAMHSFYMWTGKVPPVYAEVDSWQPYLSRERQAVERRMLEGPRSCVVYIEPLVPFWLPADNPAPRTLLGFIQEHFVEVDARDGFHFMVRK